MGISVRGTQTLIGCKKWYQGMKPDPACMTGQIAQSKPRLLRKVVLVKAKTGW